MQSNVPGEASDGPPDSLGSDALDSELSIPDAIYTDEATSPASPAAQAKVDQMIDQINQQIDLLVLDDPEPSLLRQMVRCLVDPRRAARLELVDALSQIGESATPFLLEGIEHHPESVVRRACCNALTNIGDPSAVPSLIKALLYDPDIGVKSAAAGALAKIGAPAFDSLRDVLAADTASESSKGHAAWAIASMSCEVKDRLYRLINDPAPAVRTAVMGAIAQYAQAQTAQAQAEQTQAEQAQVKQAQVKQAQTDSPRRGQSSAEKAREALIILTEALNDSSSEVRIEAAANLARLNYQDAYHPLVACLKDSNAGVRKAAVLALAKLANPQAIDFITPLQRDVDTAVQRVATMTIDQLKSLT